MSQDWLDSDQEIIARNEQIAKGREFAQNYLVFVQDGRAKMLLEHWDKTLLGKRTPVNGSIQEYAAAEAIRAFIAGIHQQIELAQSPGV